MRAAVADWILTVARTGSPLTHDVGLQTVAGVAALALTAPNPGQQQSQPPVAMKVRRMTRPALPARASGLLSLSSRTVESSLVGAHGQSPRIGIAMHELSTYCMRMHTIYSHGNARQAAENQEWQ